MPVPRLIEGVFEIGADHAPGAHFEAVCGTHRVRCASATDFEEKSLRLSTVPYRSRGRSR